MSPTDPTPPGVVPNPAAAGSHRTRRTGVIGWIKTHPGMTFALVLPFAVFGMPQLFGMTFLSGDNLIQNFPMRVLVGKDLIHGVLPLWNPYLFGGTPLLGGFNAGAAYPLTWLTAVLPIFTAWTLTLAVAYDVALAGMYVFLRRQGIASTAATFGAVTFAFAGYMTAQVVHIDLIEGAAWLPWILLAVHGLTERNGPTKRTGPTERRGSTEQHGPGAPDDTDGGSGDEEGRAARSAVRRRIRLWVLLLAVALGLTLLAGAAEAIIDSGVLVVIYWVWRTAAAGLFRRGSGRALAGSAGAVVLGVAGGVALGAAQWLPGLLFLSQSQRATATYPFFTSGSLNNRLLTLIASPFALGTNQGWPATYIGTYNFPEVTSYAGILALIAFFALLAKRWRSRPEARHWWVWYVIFVVGLLSTLGNQTPFAHLMYLIPGVSSERLLNRNLLLVDTALAVLLAWWAHLVLAERAVPTDPTPEPTSVRERWRSGRHAEVVLTALPFAFIVVVAVLSWVAGPFLLRMLENEFGIDTDARLRLAGLITAGAVVAGVATWTVLAAGRFSARRLRRQLGIVLLVDLALFNFFVVNPPITEAAAQAHTPWAARFAAEVGDGRFIVYDPDRFYTVQLYVLGQTDLNMYRELPSAQGYTALTDGAYVNATGAHLQETLSATTLAGTVWDSLNVTTLASVPGYFVTPLPTSPAPEGPISGPATAPPDQRVYFPADPAGQTATSLGGASSFALRSGVARPWYFGGMLTLSRWEVPVEQGDAAHVQVGLVTASGGYRWLPAGDVTVTGDGTGKALVVSLPDATASGGLVVRPTSGRVTVGIPSAFTAETGAVSLDGPLQYGVVPPRWTFTGTVGPFGVFHSHAARGWARVRAPGGGPAPAGASVTATAPGPYGTQTITVRAPGPVLVQRSVAWTTGWKASVQRVGTGEPGASRPLTVQRNGVIQQVDLSGPGEYRVTFRYRPAAALVGLMVSGVAGLGLLGWAAGELLGARRRRRLTRR